MLQFEGRVPCVRIGGVVPHVLEDGQIQLELLVLLSSHALQSTPDKLPDSFDLRIALRVVCQGAGVLDSQDFRQRAYRFG